MILNAEDFDNIHLKFFVLNTLVRSFKAMIINNKYMHHIDKLTVLKDRVLANVEKFEEKSLWYRTILDGTKEELTKSNFCSALKQARIDSCKNFIENYDILINKYKNTHSDIENTLNSLKENRILKLKNLSTDKLNFLEKFNY